MSSESGGRAHVSVQEIFEHIAGTPIRINILQLISDEATGLRNLSDRLDTPRTTVRHNLRKMIEAGLVEETINHKYRCTPLGESVQNAFERFGEHIETALQLEPLYVCLPPSKLDFDLCRLSDVHVTEATRPKPYAPRRRLENLSLEATEIRIAIPTTPFQLDRSDELLFDGDRAVSLFVTEDVANVFRSEYASSLVVADRKDGIELGVIDNTDLDYGVARIDECAAVLGLDETGKPQTLMETTDNAALDWASDRLDELQAAAAPLTAVTGPASEDSAND